MIVLKGEREIGQIRKAGEIVYLALEKVRVFAKPGTRTDELDAIASREITRLGAKAAFKGYRGFPANICTSINEAVVHGIPSSRKLKEGDILSVDIGVKFKDHYADAAITIPIGKVSDEARRLMMVTEIALQKGIESARPGIRLSNISNIIQKIVESSGFSVVRSFVGHGIGAKIHEEPEIPNFGEPNSGVRLEPGMALAIEPMVNAGTFEVETLEDGWTAVTKDRRLSAHFEHTIVITKKGNEVLTTVTA